MSRPISRTRSYIPHDEYMSNKYSKPMGMPTPPRHTRKEFTGRDTYNAERSLEDRNDGFYSSSSEDHFIGSAREYVSRMRDSPPPTTRNERPRSMTRSMSEYNDDFRYSHPIRSPSPLNTERYNNYHNSPSTAAHHSREDEIPSKWEIMGMKEQLKKNESTRHHLEEALENAISEKISTENRLREDMNELQRNKAEELDRLHKKYADEAIAQRNKLVETFKDDMMEMKSEWENAFTRLKEEADATKRALMHELENASDAKVDLETRLGEITAEYRSNLEEERERQQERMDDMKKEKEEELEKLRFRYEEHLDGIKNKHEEEREGLKDEIQILLEENEKIKMCYENLEEEMERAKKELHDMNMRCQAAVSDNVNYEKEVAGLKDEVDDLLDENDKLKRQVHNIQEEVKDVKMEMDRVSKENGRAQSELSRVNRDFDDAEQERNSLSKENKELVKKLETLEEERELETRYTEALVKQRDNMNAIIENCQGEIDELKASQEDYDALYKEAEKSRAELKQMEGMKEELAAVSSKADSLQRERERYNATVKALKVDLRALHQENAGAETSLQEHMRILNMKWQENASKVENIKSLEDELAKRMSSLQDEKSERERLTKNYESKIERLSDELDGTQGELLKVSVLILLQSI